MTGNGLSELIAENRALCAELRIHLEARKSLARNFCSHLNRAHGRSVDEVRIMQMTSLLLDAHKIALRDEDGRTVDLITDALVHLNRRLEREVVSSWT